MKTGNRIRQMVHGVLLAFFGIEDEELIVIEMSGVLICIDRSKNNTINWKRVAENIGTKVE